MALGITPVTILADKTAAASGSTVLSECTAVPGDALIAFGIEALMTFNAAAAVGATVKVFSSSDGTNYTTAPIQEYDITATAGATVKHGFTVLPGHKWYKVQVTNLDTVAGRDLTAITVTAEPQVLS